MRYVNVWFTCSVEGCTARTEWMVPARRAALDPDISISRDLPEGWSYQRKKIAAIGDRESTYCPEHAA